QSNEASVIPPTVPSAPQNLQATGGNARVTLSWQPPASNGGSAITYYKIYKSTSSGTEVYLTTRGNVTSYTDLAVTNGITYFYKVSALNSYGESRKSSENSATTHLAPLSLTSAPLTTTQVVPSPTPVSLTTLGPSTSIVDGLIAVVLLHPMV